MIFGKNVIKTGSQTIKAILPRPFLPPKATEQATRLLREVLDSQSVYSGDGPSGLYTSKRLDNDLLRRIENFLAANT